MGKGVLQVGRVWWTCLVMWLELVVLVSIVSVAGRGLYMVYTL